MDGHAYRNDRPCTVSPPIRARSTTACRKWAAGTWSHLLEPHVRRRTSPALAHSVAFAARSSRRKKQEYQGHACLTVSADGRLFPAPHHDRSGPYFKPGRPHNFVERETLKSRNKGRSILFLVRQAGSLDRHPSPVLLSRNVHLFLTRLLTKL